MLFNSADFLIFLVVVFALYYSLLKDHQVLLLIVSSFVFYAWGQPAWLILLFSSIGINSFASWQILKNDDPKFRLSCSIVSIALNVILLACFKYAALGVTIASNFAPMPAAVLSFALLSLPVGISFYTFEGISLIVDSFKKKTSAGETSMNASLEMVKPPTISADNHVRSTADNHVRNTALFFSFFPHLAAGPIVRPHQFYPQIGVKRFGDIDWKGSIENLITGYFFKTVIADNLASQTSPFLSHFASLSGKDVIAGWLGFSARIFSDFAGYSLIAIGLAAMFGYKLPTNFNFPYRSQSLSEFWTRWHISLSTWIRDYLYIPLGGNRKGTLRTYLNLMVVMLLGGLWHGGKVGLAVWGLYHGAGLCIERALGLSHNSSKSSAVIAFRVLTVFLFFAAGLILFELPLHMVRECLVSIVTHWKFASDAQHTFLVCLFVLPVFIWHAVDLWAQKHPEVSARKRLLKELVLATMLFMVITDSGDSREFFYFQF